MNFVRTIVNSDILTSIIEIPENLRHRKVEILILPYENVNMEENKEQKVKMARGRLEKYKNIELQSEENSAWEKAMVDKYENS
jgi:ABC-type uncharacterized transport system auxiliary subunit